MSTKIQWTNETWNPIIGCTEISEGCKNCYAKKMAFRLMRMHVSGYEFVLDNNGEEHPDDFRYIPEWNGETHFMKSALEKPFKWKKPRMIFVCSMGDLFHESVPFEWIDKVWKVMLECPQHTFQILTKRPDRMSEYIRSVWSQEFSNIWLGATVENQKQAYKRIPILLSIPAAKHFISCEPLLSEMYITNGGLNNAYSFPTRFDERGNGIEWTDPGAKYIGLDWVIAGPETGAKSKCRPMKKEWIENIYNQCKVANVPFFDKKDTLGLGLKQFPNE